jgi:hypothetical protein
MQLPHERLRRGFENQLLEHGFKASGRNGDDQPEDEADATRAPWIRKVQEATQGLPSGRRQTRSQTRRRNGSRCWPPGGHANANHPRAALERPLQREVTLLMLPPGDFDANSVRRQVDHEGRSLHPRLLVRGFPTGFAVSLGR